jgi:hypothetical protein
MLLRGLSKRSKGGPMWWDAFPGEISALMVVFGVLEEERLKWQKVGMRAEDIVWIEEAAKALEQEPLRLDFLEETLVV